MTSFLFTFALATTAHASMFAHIKGVCAGALRGLPAEETTPIYAVAQRHYLESLRNEIAQIEAKPFDPIWFDGILLNDWSRSDGGACEPLSFQLLKALHRFPNVKYRTVVNYRPILLLDGEKIDDFVGHSFLSDSTFGASNEILIDPTYLQFLRDGGSLGLPPIFVGTRAALEEIFSRFSGHLRKQNSFRRFSNIDVSAYAQKLYGYGRAARDRRTQDYFAGPERSIYP